jgi:hypothetical protein
MPSVPDAFLCRTAGLPFRAKGRKGPAARTYGTAAGHTSVLSLPPEEQRGPDNCIATVIASSARQGLDRDGARSLGSRKRGIAQAGRFELPNSSASPRPPRRLDAHTALKLQRSLAGPKMASLSYSLVRNEMLCRQLLNQAVREKPESLCPDEFLKGRRSLAVSST